MANDRQPPTLAETEAHFAEWRRTRTKPRTPTRLKEQAVALLSRHSRGEVCKRLGVGHAMLKRWQSEVGQHEAAAFIALPTVAASTSSGLEGRTPLKLTRQRVDGEVISVEGELSEAQWRWALGLLAELSQ